MYRHVSLLHEPALKLPLTMCMPATRKCKHEDAADDSTASSRREQITMGSSGELPGSCNNSTRPKMEGQVSEAGHTLTLAPEPRAPATMDAWLRASLITRQPLPTSRGMMAELVANPMPNVIAASLPRKLATQASSCLCLSVVPGTASLTGQECKATQSYVNALSKDHLVAS